jgi:hypothetical protein
MITASKAPVPWVVPWNNKQRLFFRAGDVIERSEFEGEIAGEHGAGRVFDFQLNAAFIQGVETLLQDTPDDAAQIREWAQTAAAGDTLQPEEAAALAEAKDTVLTHWPPYRALSKQLGRRNQLLPVLAFRRYCTGWEGEGLPEFAKAQDGQLSLEVMGQLDDFLLRSGGAYAYSLQYGGGQEKNSARPLSSGKGRKTSASRKPPAGGKSPGKPGSKTPS